MIPNLSEGDTVDITIRGAKVYALPDPDDDPGERFWTFQLAERLFTKPPVFSVPLDYSEVTVEHSGPEGWPPQAGDIWADQDNDEWIVTRRDPEDDALRFSLVDASTAAYREVSEMDDLFPMRLVRRREAP